MKIDQSVTVINKLGLHARAAAKLVKLASAFQSQILLKMGETEVDAKSIMGIMMLAATQGTTLGLVVEGDDAEQATQAVVALFEDYFGEGE